MRLWMGVKRGREAVSAAVVVLCAAWTLPWAQGCGELASGGVQQGEAVVFLAGDGSAGRGATASRALASAEYSVAGTPADSVKGTVAVRIQVFIRAADGTWSELTPAEREASVDAEGTLEVEVGRRPLDVGPYDRLRMVFRRVEADVTGGLIIDGIPVVGRISVNFGGSDTVEVERAIAVFMGEGETVELVVDLNSSAWLRAANPATRIVAAAHFRDAVEVRVR